MQQYVNRNFSSRYKATIGADFLTKDIALSPSTFVTMQIWDTAGQERFMSLGTCFYRGADACVLVYDVTSRQSFDHLDDWREDFMVQAAPNDPASFPFVVVGNKVDAREGRVVDPDRAREYCSRTTKGEKNDDIDRSSDTLGRIEHFETSARLGLNVEETFRRVAEMALERIDKEENDASIANSSIKLDLCTGVSSPNGGKGSNGEKRGGCC